MHIFVGLLLIFLYEVGAAVILPTPSEIPILGYNYIPLAWMFVFAVLGKTVGAYIVFMVGDRAKETARFQRLEFPRFCGQCSARYPRCLVPW